MFVLKSTLEKIETQLRFANARLAAREKELAEQVGRYNSLLRKHNTLMSEHNYLVGVVNDRGGWKFLNNAVMPDKLAAQFSQTEIKKLIMLCHPDKHGGKAIATEITQKLMSLRK